MSEYKYKLDASPKKFNCPECNKKRFVRYIDRETGEYLPEQYGRCDREENCSYWRNPYKDGYFKNKTDWKPTPSPPPKPITFIKPEILTQSQKGYENNNLVKFLKTKFSPKIVDNLIETYNIGTSNQFGGGSIVFWQVDINSKIRTGKIMQYSSTKGKRIKEPTNCINWVHSTLKMPDFNLKQCFFGEHLIKRNNKPIAIVESEKTAIISSVYFPDFVWIATGGKNGIRLNNILKIYSGRNVYLFPDLGAYDNWSKKAKEIPIKIKVSDLLEHNANEAAKKQGYDLADYLIEFKYQKFRKIVNNEKTKTKPMLVENSSIQVVQKFKKENELINEKQLELN